MLLLVCSGHQRLGGDLHRVKVKTSSLPSNFFLSRDSSGEEPLMQRASAASQWHSKPVRGWAPSADRNQPCHREPALATSAWANTGRSSSQVHGEPYLAFQCMLFLIHLCVHAHIQYTFSESNHAAGTVIGIFLRRKIIIHTSYYFDSLIWYNSRVLFWWPRKIKDGTKNNKEWHKGCTLLFESLIIGKIII